MKAILGRKIGMTRIFNKDGKVTPVTVLQAGPCLITQVKAKEKDGYSALQIGFGQTKHLTKPLQGHLKTTDSQARWLREIKVSDSDQSESRSASISDQNQDQRQSATPKVGDKITVEVFQPGDKVIVTAVSKGKGFAGTVKRHGFTTGPKTHGSCNYRKPGSIGDTGPQRVVKGKRMSGHLGAKKTTISNLQVQEIDVEKHLLVVKGSVPGSNKGLVMIREE